MHHIPGRKQASAECPPHTPLQHRASGPVGKVSLACSLLDSERSAFPPELILRTLVRVFFMRERRGVRSDDWASPQSTEPRAPAGDPPVTLNVTGHSQCSSYCRAPAPLACDFNYSPPHPTPGIHSWFLQGEPGATPRGERPMGNAGLRDRW